MPFVDQLDQTVEKIIDHAIDFYMWTAGSGYNPIGDAGKFLKEHP